jgi:hypothetical protein
MASMADSVTEARKRQIARLDGARPPSARKAMALAKSKAYQDGADAEATLRWDFDSWCVKTALKPALCRRKTGNWLIW